MTDRELRIEAALTAMNSEDPVEWIELALRALDQASTDCLDAGWGFPFTGAYGAVARLRRELEAAKADVQVD